MTNLETIQNKDQNVKLELAIGAIALVISLIFVSTKRIGEAYQVYYVIIIFGIHQRLNQQTC